MTCPKCSDPIPDGMAECPRCVAIERQRRSSRCVTWILVAGFGLLFTVIASIATRGAGERSKQATLTTHLTSLNNAVTLYTNDMGHPPAKLEDVCAPNNPSPSRDYNGPYLRAIPVHPYTNRNHTWWYDPATGRVSTPAERRMDWTPFSPPLFFLGIYVLGVLGVVLLNVVSRRLWSSRRRSYRS